jgi:hypothetical protein
MVILLPEELCRYAKRMAATCEIGGLDVLRVWKKRQPGGLTEAQLSGSAACVQAAGA